MDSHPCFNKVYGGLLASAIGDAMGGPVEMWSPDDMARQHGWIATLLPYTSPPNPTYVWEPQAPAGMYTDDTRLKLIMAELVAHRGQDLDAHDLADEFILRYEAAEDGTLEQEWLTEWTDVSRAFLTDLSGNRSAGLHGFYGGEMICGGLITVLPLGFIFPNDPRRAYTTGFDLAFFDLGYARDATAMATALVSRAMCHDASLDRLLDGVLDDPHQLSRRHIFGRVCGRYVELALDLARKATSREELIESFHRVLLRATPCDPAEMLAIAIGILAWTDGDPAVAIPLAVNAGRDNDSIAGVVGMVAGTLNGFDALPTRWVTTVEQANPTPDMQDLATRICEKIPG